VVILPEAVWEMTGEAVELASYSGPYQYFWSTGSTSQAIEVQEPGFYWVMVSDTFCTARDTVEVIEIPAIFIPNAFTPNGDGLNDVFGPVSDDLLSVRFWVFNRWGEQVFESSSHNCAWDGIFKGNPAPCEVYSWVLEWEYTYLTAHKSSMSLNGKKQGIVLLLR
jgi:gliding motility-associated-like protein